MQSYLRCFCSDLCVSKVVPLKHAMTGGSDTSASKPITIEQGLPFSHASSSVEELKVLVIMKTSIQAWFFSSIFGGVLYALA